MNRLIIVVSIAAFLSGCSGAMNGMVRNDGSRVSISYQIGMEHDDLQVTMPDGETFTGKVVMVDASETHASGGFGSKTGPSFGVVNTYTGNKQGVLFGDKGHTMQCRLQYADLSGFATSGGVGLCETSDNRVIDVQW